MNDGLTFEQRVKAILAIEASIKPLLANHVPGVQGAVLADLLALWLAGHPPHLREGLLEHHLLAVRELVPVNERALFGPGGHPGMPS